MQQIGLLYLITLSVISCTHASKQEVLPEAKTQTDASQQLTVEKRDTILFLSQSTGRKFYTDDPKMNGTLLKIVKIEEQVTGNYENRDGFELYGALDLADTRELYQTLTYDDIGNAIITSWKKSISNRKIEFKNSTPLVYFRNYNLFALTPYFDNPAIILDRTIIRKPKYSFKESLDYYNLFFENYEANYYHIDIEHVNFIKK